MESTERSDTVAELKKRALALLSVRSIVTIMLTCLVCYLAVERVLPSEAITGFFGTVLTFFFVTKDKAEQKEG